MPERVFGDKHVQGDRLKFEEISGYLAKAISKWPDIAPNGQFEDRTATYELIMVISVIVRSFVTLILIAVFWSFLMVRKISYEAGCGMVDQRSFDIP